MFCDGFSGLDNENDTAVEYVFKRVLIDCQLSDSYFIDNLGFCRTVLALKCAFQGLVAC